MTKHVHHAGCGCIAALSRRSLFGMGIAGAAMMAAPRLGFAQKPSVVYEAMLMNCIDPRFSTFTWAHMVPGLFSPCGTMQAAGGSYQWTPAGRAEPSGMEA